MPLIAELQRITRPLGYHVAVGGGVLNKGRSQKDLDLYVLPLNNFSRYPLVQEALREVLTYVGPIQRDPDYTGERGKYENAAMDEASYYSWEGKRVDVFVITCHVSLTARRLTQ